MSVNLDIKRFDKILNITSRVCWWMQVPPLLKFTKFIVLSQFVKNPFFKYPVFMSKTTSLLKHMTEKKNEKKTTDKCRNELSSCMTLVALDQNVKTYPTTQCKFLLLLKMGGACIHRCLLDAIYWIMLNLLVVLFTDTYACLGLQTELWDYFWLWRKLVKTKWPVRTFG